MTTFCYFYLHHVLKCVRLDVCVRVSFLFADDDVVLEEENVPVMAS